MADMEKKNFGYSMKNIPLHSFKEYKLQLLDSMGKFVHNLRWRAFFFKNQDKSSKRKKPTYDFRSLRQAPACHELRKLEESLYDMARNVKPRKFHNSLQTKLTADKNSISNEERLFVAADKTSNFYKMKKEDYNRIMETEIHKNYKKANKSVIEKANRDHNKIVTELELEDRVFSSTERPAFVTLKDHKPNFENNPKVRLLNPTKPEIGRISKQILASKVRLLREKTEFNQWQNSFSVIDWFKRISNKSHCKFIFFDMYTSQYLKNY